MKTKLIYAVSIVALCALSFYLGWFIHKPIAIPVAEITPAPTEPVLYRTYTYDKCPAVDTADDYVCVSALVDKTTEEASTIEEKLAAHEKSDMEISGFTDALKEKLKIAKDTKNAYFTAVCDLAEVRVYGGSGMGLERESCKYHYLQQYIDALKAIEAP